MVATNSVAPRTGQRQRRHQHLRDGRARARAEPRAPRTRPGHHPGRRPGGDGALQQRRQRAGRLGGRVRRVRRRARAAAADRTPSSRRCSPPRSTATPDGGGLLAYNYLSGRAITGLDEGRPLFVRTPDSRFSLANFMRAQLYGAFATLRLGMRRTATEEGVALDSLFAHGGLFKTRGVAQRYLAAAVGRRRVGGRASPVRAGRGESRCSPRTRAIAPTGRRWPSTWPPRCSPTPNGDHRARPDRRCRVRRLRAAIPGRPAGGGGRGRPHLTRVGGAFSPGGPITADPGCSTPRRGSRPVRPPWDQRRPGRIQRPGGPRRPTPGVEPNATTGLRGHLSLDSVLSA